MRYDPLSEKWEVSIIKKGDAGVIYYYITILYNGEQTRYPTEGYESYVYSPGGGINLQFLCLILFFIFFIIFELVMRYPLIKRKYGESAEAPEDEIHGEAVVKCQKCGMSIPISSEKCPYCGYPQKEIGKSKEITMGND